MQVLPFYHQATNSWSYLLADEVNKVCALIDPVLDFEPASGAIQHDFVEVMLSRAADQQWQVAWFLRLTFTPIISRRRFCAWPDRGKNWDWPGG